MAASGPAPAPVPGFPLVRPFAALRPAREFAAEVIAAPYDVLTVDEARRRAGARPWSFLHVSRPEVDLAPEIDPHSPEAYAKAADNMRRMLAAGVLRRDAAPAYYLYRMRHGGHVQTGLAVAAALAAYRSGRIRRHEQTRPDKVADRARQIEAVRAQTGPVLLAHRPRADLSALYAEATAAAPDYTATTEDGVVHSLWRVNDEARVRRFTGAFEDMAALYIADGHHRSEAALQVADGRRATDRGGGGEPPAERFLAVAFPSDELRVLGYHRTVRDLAGMTAESFLARLGAVFAVSAAEGGVAPPAPRHFGMYLGGRWYNLRLEREPPPATPPAERLDVALLSRHLLAPVLGIGDPRSDARIDFIGGERGLDALAERVDSGAAAVAFALHPTGTEELMAVADAGGVMPPKSTWFQPKLADGLVSYPLD